MPTYILTFIGSRGGRVTREEFAEGPDEALEQGVERYPEKARRAKLIDVARKPGLEFNEAVEGER